MTESVSLDGGVAADVRTKVTTASPTMRKRVAAAGGEAPTAPRPTRRDRWQRGGGAMAARTALPRRRARSLSGCQRVRVSRFLPQGTSARCAKPILAWPSGGAL